jgi:hypothetical protein
MVLWRGADYRSKGALCAAPPAGAWTIGTVRTAAPAPRQRRDELLNQNAEMQ